MRVAVYPGSFDPLHIGHKAILEYLTGDGSFDAVYLVVSPQNPFKDPSKALNARKRYEAAVAAVARHPELRVKVDDIELGMDPPNYTIRTLDALKAREPDNSFTLVMGADNLEGLPRWRCSRRILSDYEIVVYPRPGYDSEMLLDKLHEHCRQRHVRCSVTLIDAPLVDISSTGIRKAVAKGRDMSGYLM
ncbi:MAG: nicotinate (nicotinamide) nucleotide adenylyltransferase [Bacteroidales bacterium]|nr:nicotinate (nicotinamide) nucleotide adenylyltransferase [Bacteroidales bacterium]